MYCPKCMKVLKIRTIIETDEIIVQIVECDCDYCANKITYKTK